ncbi:DMT family transporter [Desulfogranum mediterraneum]|uniref:DMT family transporter n=1 Tax=Desulfogranum mediterraneum TaxID=160661 RepID=UPI0004232FB2|nr:DMT family transporter [Desulfogranum mediterraneum]
MKDLLFYTATVLIWGSTWIGIKLQLGSVDPMVSVIYRFALASLLLFCWCMIFHLKMRFSGRQHLFMAMQGGFLFGFNYLFFYLAELSINSGLAAVLFSTILVMNVINSAIFLGKPVEKKVALAALFGLSGIILVFRPEISSFTLENHGVRGGLLCILATLLASFGNITSAYNQKSNRLPIIQSNAYGMAYGTLAILATALVTGRSFTLELTPLYLGSLCYLALFGSVIAFGCYLALVGRIGADRAAYATLLFPIVALLISTIWEGYQWSGSAALGVFLILAGNLIMVHKPGLVRPLGRLVFAPMVRKRL